MPSFPLGKQNEMPAMELGEKLRQVYGLVFGKGWPLAVGAIALAVVNVFFYIYDRPLGVTGELSAWSDRIASGLFRIQAPALLGVDGLAGCNLTAACRFMVDERGPDCRRRLDYWGACRCRARQ